MYIIFMPLMVHSNQLAIRRLLSLLTLVNMLLEGREVLITLAIRHLRVKDLLKNVASKAGLERTTLGTKGAESINETPRPTDTNCTFWPLLVSACCDIRLILVRGATV